MRAQRRANGGRGFDGRAKGGDRRQRAPHRLALVISLLAMAAGASAQPFSCTATAQPSRIRSAGLTELAGDVLLVCAGGSGGSVSVNLQVFLTVNVTSRLLSGTTSEALLLIDDPAPAGRVVGKNVFRGQIAGPNSIVWLGVTVPTPAGGTTTLRITNVRVNASQLTPAGIPQPVIMSLTVTSKIGIPINNPTLTVAVSLPGLGQDVRKCDDSGTLVAQLPAYGGVNEELALGRSKAGNIQFNLRFREGFSNAFRNRADENGLVLATSDNTGQATQGTRLRAVFSGVPAGARLYVTTTALSPASSSGVSATLVSEGMEAPPAPAGTGLCTLVQPPASAPIAAVPIIDGWGTAAWEITSADASRDETFSFGVVIAYPSASGIPGPEASVRASFSPLSGVYTASLTEPAPRFRSPDPEPVVPAFSLVAAPSPSITTVSPLPQGVAGASYSVTLSATDGALPFGSWAVVSGTLPPGLTLDPSTGTLSGVPKAAGSASFVVRTVDSYGVAATKSFSVLVIPGPPSITTPPVLPVGTVGIAYALNLQASGGTPPYVNWLVTAGSLPSGLTLGASTGQITGTPTTAGTYKLTVQVNDSATPTPQTASKPFELTINPAALSITTASLLPVGTVNVAYSQPLTATGGTPPYVNWLVTTGSLPSGLTLGASTGQITGTPTTAGTYKLTVQVSDSATPTPQTASKPFDLTINPAVLSITTASPLPVGTVSAAYSQPLTATGGVPPYTWSLTGGALPAGLSLNPKTGVLAGTPVGTGTFVFTVQVTDAAGAMASRSFTLVVVTALKIIVGVPGRAEGTVGVFFWLPLTASGGRSPYFWRHTGELPPGLLLGPGSGILSGTPLVPGESTTLITVTDSIGAVGQLALTLLIHPPPLQAAPDRISVALGPASPAIQRTISVVYPGRDRLPFSVRAETSAAGAWLSVTPTAGVVSAGAPVRLAVTVSPSSLAPGFYAGRLLLASVQPGVQPLTIPVVVQIRDREQPQLRLSKSGIAFVTRVGGAAAERELGILNVGQGALNWSARATTLSGGAWLSATPEAGSSLPSGAAPRLRLRASGLSAGVHYGEIVVSSREAPNSPQRVVVVNVVQAAAASGGAAVLLPELETVPAGHRPRELGVTDGCQPYELRLNNLRVPGLGSGNPKAGRLYDLEVQVGDNCNTQVTSGAVIATFTNGDPAVDLETLKDGGWHGAWQPKNTQPSQVTIQVKATSGSLTGTAELTVGGVEPDTASPPVVSRGGVLNAASYLPQSLVARGSLVAIFGSGLGPSPGTTAESGPSWPQVLGDTSVTLAGVQMPLYHAGESQINAQAPFGVTASVGHNLTVRRGNTLSQPEEVTVSEVLPAIFTTNQQGTGQGSIRVANTGMVAASSGTDARSATAGEYIEIYCTGLGQVKSPAQVTPPVLDGVPAPLTGELFETVKPVSVLIDGVEVTPLFSGLAPGFVALYQVNAKVPESTKAGPAVSVQLKMQGQPHEANKVTIAVK